jgi:2'-hydroxyisoflavone reductase
MGGTLFVGRHIVETALKRGHDVTIFNRGRQNPSLFPEIERLVGDRETDLSALAGREFDAVIDPCAYTPEHIHLLLSTLKAPPKHYTFVSTVSVYHGFPPGVRYDEDTEVLVGNDGYGALKAMAEFALQSAVPGSVAILRPGLIVGPHDPKGRFTYWIRRIAAGGRVLAPGRPDRPIQYIDVRDLAQWCLQLTEDKINIVLNAAGPASTLTMEQLLNQCVEVCESRAQIAWLADQQVIEAGIEAWTELPLWVAESDALAGGIFHADNSRARKQGLTFSPLSRTIQDSFEWIQEAGEEQAPPAPALTFEKEQATLARFGTA